MPTNTIANVEVELNNEGFFVDPSQWTEDMVPELARREGIEELTDAHWQVIRFMRTEYLVKGTGPTVRVLGKTSGAICSSPSSVSMLFTRLGTNTSNWRPSGIPASISPRWQGDFPGCLRQ